MFSGDRGGPRAVRKAEVGVKIKVKTKDEDTSKNMDAND